MVKATVAAVVVFGAFGLGACGGDDEKTGPAAASSTSATTSAALPETDDGAEGSRPAISVGAGIRAVAPEDHGQSAATSARIIGGSAVTIEQYPWQVAIAIAPAAAPPGSGARDRMHCGGTLVAPTIVVTAAHCVYDTKRKEFLPIRRSSQ